MERVLHFHIGFSRLTPNDADSFCVKIAATSSTNVNEQKNEREQAAQWSRGFRGYNYMDISKFNTVVKVNQTALNIFTFLPSLSLSHITKLAAREKKKADKLI